VDSCQHLKQLNLEELYQIDDGDLFYIIDKLGKHLTTLVLGGDFTDVGYLYLNKCAR
jgi:hypothetical protein